MLAKGAKERLKLPRDLGDHFSHLICEIVLDKEKSKMSWNEKKSDSIRRQRQRYKINNIVIKK